MDSALLDAIARGGSIVTATRRLSRELRRLHDRAMQHAGLTAWESADILPWDAWVRRCWDLGPGEARDAPMVLSDSQLYLLWQDIVERDVSWFQGGELPLWNIEATAAAAIGSLRLLREWRIAPEQLRFSRHPDHAAYRRWLAEFEARCGNRLWIDRHQLADRLVAGGFVPDHGPVIVVGFDCLTPQQDRLIEHLRDGNGEVMVRIPPVVGFDTIPCHAYPDAREQWFAAAAWACDRATENPAARVAIVVPDLEACRLDLTAALTEILAPESLVDPGESRDLPFHVSLGDRLGRHPLARGLMDLLTALTADQLTLEQSETLLLSPVLGGSGDELQSRASAALALRERLPWRHDIGDLLHELERTDCPQLVERLHRARARVLDTPIEAPLSLLSAALADLIDDLGWPATGIALDSDQFQAREAIRARVSGLCGLEMVRRATTLANAVTLLGHDLSAQTFQPEAPDAVVEVLDIREAAGLVFDHVWFADLTGERWPAPATADPFIPVSVQREAGCPGTDVNRDTELSARRHGRLAASTVNLVQSRPLREGETGLMASPLVHDLSSATEGAGRPTPAIPLAARVKAAGVTMDAVEDDFGPPHPGGAAQGGTGLIQRQSACPRSAFLRDRLGATDHPFNRTGLDPGRRGTLVHRLLDGVWRELGTSENLAATGEDALADLIRQVIAVVSRRDRPISGCGDAFFDTQKLWLMDTLLEWFRLERARSEAFEVVAREETVSLALRGLELQFKIDRVDRFEDGSLALIDYKTGSGQSISGWFDERPPDPQLPLYALSGAQRGQAISVIAFARVRLGECTLDGLLDPELRLAGSLGSQPGLRVNPPGARPQLRPDFEHWQDHLPRWRDTLGNLAGEFLAGDARINPGNDGICAACRTPAFCRSAHGLDPRTIIDYGIPDGGTPDV